MNFANSLYNQIFSTATHRVNAEKGARKLICHEGVTVNWVKTLEKGVDLYHNIIMDLHRLSFDYSDDLNLRFIPAIDYRESFFEEMQRMITMDTDSQYERDVYAVFKSALPFDINEYITPALFEKTQQCIINNYCDSAFIGVCLFLHENNEVTFNPVTSKALEAYKQILTNCAGMFYIHDNIILIEK